ncbi:MAG: hypothetical protein IKE21_00725 [Erysipelotrichaceae bacterium]|nr:hypothetical protein [Erysipelotrichaceae bacterium]
MKKLLAVLLALAMVLAMAGCSGSGSSAAPAPASSGETPASSETPAAEVDANINVMLTTSPIGLHPLKTNDSPSTYVNGQMFETLYRRTIDGTDYKPLLAAELPEFSEDGLTATIKLREGVTFHDGTPFTSAAVGYMIDCLKDPDYGSQRPSIVESIESYECPDDNTIVLHLAYVDGVLVAKLAHTNGCIVNPELDKTQDLMVNPAGAGTGPYKFVSAVAGSNYKLEANENYWEGAPEVKTVNVDVVPDETTAIARLKTGEGDFIPTLLADSFDEANSIEGYTAVSTPSSAIFYLAYRSSDTAKNDIMADPEFRKMLIEAVDLEFYTENMMGIHATHVKSIVGPTLVGYTPAMDEAYIAPNLENAKATVEAKGWTGTEITMLVSTREWHQTVAAYVKGELAKAGITVNIISEEWGTFLDDMKKDDYYDFGILSWSNVTGDGQQMLEPNFSTKNGVRLKYNNAEFDAEVEASARTTVLEERQEHMLNAVKMIQGDAIVTPLYSDNARFCYNSAKFGNVNLDKGGQFYLNDFTLVK